MYGLFNIETKILAKFRRLSSLEIDGRQGDKKYIDIKADLCKKIKEEESILETISLASIAPQKLESCLEAAGQINESVKLRILSRITDILIKDLVKDQENKQYEAEDMIIKEAQSNVMMFEAKFIRDYILEEQDENIKKLMILNFYEICYLHPKLSELFIDDNFDITKDCFRSCYFIADVLGVNRDYAQKLIDEHCAELLFHQFAKIFFDEDYSDPEIFEFNKKMTLCAFNAFEMILSTSGYEKAYDAILNAIKENNLTNHPNYDFAMSLFANPDRPKGEAPTITFGRP